jgi:ketosteroid isomerase-like protein
MQRSQELLDAVLQMLRDIDEGRITSPDDVMSNSDAVSSIGNGPAQWWMGREICAQLVEGTFAAAREYGPSTEISHAQAWAEGDLGFAVYQVAATLKDGRSFPPSNMTHVLHKEDGKWKIVHQHLSSEVPSDQAEESRGTEGATAPA